MSFVGKRPKVEDIQKGVYLLCSPPPPLSSPCMGRGNKAPQNLHNCTKTAPWFWMVCHLCITLPFVCISSTYCNKEQTPPLASLFLLEQEHADLYGGFDKHSAHTDPNLM